MGWMRQLALAGNIKTASRLCSFLWVHYNVDHVTYYIASIRPDTSYYLMQLCNNAPKSWICNQVSGLSTQVTRRMIGPSVVKHCLISRLEMRLSEWVSHRTAAPDRAERRRGADVSHYTRVRWFEELDVVLHAAIRSVWLLQAILKRDVLSHLIGYKVNWLVAKEVHHPLIGQNVTHVVD